MIENRFASSAPACQLIIALLVFAQIPILFGQVPSESIIYAMPWILAAYPVILICIIFMYRNDQFVDATLNAFLSGVLMGQNFVKGIVELVLMTGKVNVSEQLLLAGQAIDKWAFLAGGIVLLVACILEAGKSKMAAIGLFGGAAGFLSMTAFYSGVADICALAGGTGILILGIYLLYAGLAGLVNNACQREVLPVK